MDIYLNTIAVVLKTLKANTSQVPGKAGPSNAGPEAVPAPEDTGPVSDHRLQFLDCEDFLPFGDFGLGRGEGAALASRRDLHRSP